MDIRGLTDKVEAAQAVLRKRRRILASAGVCFLALLVGYHVVAGSNGIKAYCQKRSENKALEQQIDDLKKENEFLNKRVKALKSDPDAIEKEAREQLKYAKPGEVVYVAPEPKQPTPPANATAANKP